MYPPKTVAKTMSIPTNPMIYLLRSLSEEKPMLLRDIEINLSIVEGAEILYHWGISTDKQSEP
jgi:hypothetical protein